MTSPWRWSRRRSRTWSSRCRGFCASRHDGHPAGAAPARARRAPSVSLGGAHALFRRCRAAHARHRGPALHRAFRDAPVRHDHPRVHVGRALGVRDEGGGRGGGGGPVSAAVYLVAGFVGLLGLDWMFRRQGLAPHWWMRLRLLLTAVVVVCLLTVVV